MIFQVVLVCVGHSGGLFGPALGADTENLHAMSEYAIITPIIGIPPRKVKGRPVDVVDPTAADAAEVVVTRDVAIETGLGAREFQLSDRVGPRQQLQIAVNRTQTDFGDPPADNFVKRSGRGVRIELFELFEDHLPLAGTTLLRFRTHEPPYRY
jgi:hypothetical protein